MCSGCLLTVRIGGDKPSLSDLAVFGIFHCIKGLDAHKDVLANTRIGPWYERMTVEVGPSMATMVAPETIQIAHVPETSA